jgi:tetratricopeptide (TPR) repeat protein
MTAVQAKEANWQGHMSAAQAALDAGDDIQAEMELRASIQAAEHGNDSLQLAASLSNLAALYDAYGECEAALPLYERALGIMEAAFGPQSAEAASVLNNLAELFRSWERNNDAIPLYERAIAIQEKTLGPDHTRRRRSCTGGRSA